MPLIMPSMLLFVFLGYAVETKDSFLMVSPIGADVDVDAAYKNKDIFILSLLIF